jgi:hypothetical protein
MARGDRSARRAGRRRFVPLALDGISTYPLAERASKLSLAQAARPHRPGASFGSFLDGLPRVLGALTLRALRDEILRGRARRRPLVWGLGAHVVKVGLSPVVVDLAERGFVTVIATNGAGVVHDFELAVAGRTSEDVAAGLGSGSFGMARETGEEINRAIVAGDRDGLGLAAAVGRYLCERRPRPAHLEASLLAAAWRLGLLATAHVAIGTDIVHLHPACDPGAVGRSTHLDFRLFAAEVARLGRGGVYLNVGSAVVLPEVFLKAVTLARNLGHRLLDFTTANLDFIQHYRPTENVLKRPIRKGGTGIAITGHHELNIPILAACLVESTARRRPTKRNSSSVPRQRSHVSA